MKIIKFVGGLGNQMFQYAFYKSCAAFDSETYADLTQYKTQKFHQGFELEKIFNVELRRANIKQIRKFGYASSKLDQLTQRFFRKKESYVREKCIGYDTSIYEKMDTGIYFDGFWQSYKYFISFQDALQADFQCKKELSLESKKLIDRIDDHMVAVHIRRADFLDKRNAYLMNLCKSKYYTLAINKVKEFINDPQFVFFSDDLNWVKENFCFDNSIFVDWNTGTDSYQDMIIMSYCKNIIMANSTFSWWGAWLNPLSKNKVVVCPRKWYNVSSVDGRFINTDDLILPGWVTI